MTGFASIAVKPETKQRFDHFREGLAKVGKVSQDAAINYMLDRLEKK